MQYLKQATASQSVLIGPFVDVTDGATAETALTIANTDIRLSKNGGNMAAKNSGGGTHDELGYYAITLDATDTGTVGRLQLCVSDAAALPVRHEYQVLEEAVYDDLFAASAAGYAGVSELATVDSNVDAILVDTGTTLDAALAVVDANVDAILVDTDVIDDGTSGLVKIAQDVAAILVDTGTTIPGTITTAQNDLDIITGASGVNLLTATQASIDAIEVDTSTTLDTHLTDIKGAGFSGASDSLEAIRDRGDAAWTGNPTTVTSGTAQAGAAGSITLAAGESAVDNLHNGQVIYLTGGTGAGQSRAIDGYTGSSKVATVITDWVTNPSSDTTYEITPNDITEVTAAPTAAAVADAVWDENTAGHTTGGTFGEQCKNDIDAILADTAEVQGDWVNGGRLDLILDIIAADTTTDIPALIATAQADLDIITGASGVNLLTATQASIDAIEVDTGTTLDAAIATAQADLDIITGASGVNLLTATQASIDAIEADTGTDGVVLAADQGVDVTKISGNAAAADNLEATSRAAITGTAQTGTLSTTVMTSSLTGYVDDELIGRVVIWYSGTANGQASDITDYASSSGTVTYTAINTAPVNGDLFVIV